jgi:hypothetical protein
VCRRGYEFWRCRGGSLQAIWTTRVVI